MNNLGVEFRYGMVEKIEKKGEEFEIRTDEGELRGRTAILATGSRDRPLDAPNEEKLVGHGISYCATCDGELYRGRALSLRQSAIRSLSRAERTRHCRNAFLNGDPRTWVSRFLYAKSEEHLLPAFLAHIFMVFRLSRKEF